MLQKGQKMEKMHSQIFGCLVCCSSLLLPSAILAQTALEVIERSAHQKVIQSTRLGTNEFGEAVEIASQYVAIQNGMCYWQNGAWTDSEEFFELSPDGTAAYAEHGQHVAVASANLNSEGAIEITTPIPEQFTLRANLLGLALYDASTSQWLWIATVKDSIGELLPPDYNSIVYRDVLDTIKCDARYSYRKGAWEQDLILRQNISPKDYGLSEEFCRLVVITEWLQPPPPQISQTLLKKEFDPQRSAQMLDPDVLDDTVTFGQMSMILGKAYLLNDPTASAGNGPSAVPVAKRWLHFEAENRDVLAESVDYLAIKPYLASLPAVVALQAQVSKPGPLEQIL